MLRPQRMLLSISQSCSSTSLPYSVSDAMVPAITVPIHRHNTASPRPLISCFKNPVKTSLFGFKISPTVSLSLCVLPSPKDAGKKPCHTLALFLTVAQ